MDQTSFSAVEIFPRRRRERDAVGFVSQGGPVALSSLTD
jgi:hypothetical protein